MLGIGADHKNSAEGLAWKQNKDFESLLRRLNAPNGDGEEEEEVPTLVDTATKPSRNVPEVDEDGFTLVKGKGKR